MSNRNIVIRSLGREAYEPLWRKMQKFTDERDDTTPDELWFAEHPPVFTLGLNASKEHLLNPGNIPVVQVDRGGQVTYHGPGQLMIYPMISLKRAKLGVRDLVTALEQATIQLLEEFKLVAIARKDAPGVYVNGQKVASVGLRIRRGASYHGMALNIDVDLKPFNRINTCGFRDLEVTDLRKLGIDSSRETVEHMFQQYLLQRLDMTAT